MNPDTKSLVLRDGLDRPGPPRPVASLTHGGVIDGFRVQVTLLPDAGVGFALLNNLHETRMNQAATNALIDLACGLPPRDWNAFFQEVVREEELGKAAALRERREARKPGTKPSVELTAFAGRYGNPAYGTAAVAHGVNGLSLAWSSFLCPLEHWEGDEFRVTAGYFADKMVEFHVHEGLPAALRFADQRFDRGK